MRAMVLRGPGSMLELAEVPVPVPGPGQVQVAVHACGVCRTDLHILDGEICGIRSPVIPGHEIVGIVSAVGSEVRTLHVGDRVGVPWLGWTCGSCRYCLGGRENLCASAQFTGCTIDGGYAEYAVADARYCFPLPREFSDVAARAAAVRRADRLPRRCGWRATRRRVGIYGFGAAAHIVAQVARYEGREFYAFTRPGDDAAQAFARELGAAWAGGSDERAPGRARRGDHLRAGGRRWCPRRSPTSARAAPSSAAAST